jgi:hypothetical protein
MKMLDTNTEQYNDVDLNGNPTGGHVTGTGLSIQWQNGPLGRDAERQVPNGAFVETVIQAARQRIEFYQTASNGKFACEENASALTCLDDALKVLDSRTKKREARQVEGTHTA